MAMFDNAEPFNERYCDAWYSILSDPETEIFCFPTIGNVEEYDGPAIQLAFRCHDRECMTKDHGEIFYYSGEWISY